MRCQAAVTEADACAVGRALAEVHEAGRAAHRGVSRFAETQLEERLDRIAAAPDPEHAAQAGPLRAALRVWSARRDPALPRGLIHGDLFRDNVLWDGPRITALLDFESASDGVLAYDLMVTVLAWCYGGALDTGLARALVGGYGEVRAPSPAEARGLLAEGCLAALRFTITRITDYAMRTGEGPRVIKDWRRFAARFAALEALGAELAPALGL
jgi:homoserine kinase type II